MNKKNKYIVAATIVFLAAFSTKVIEAFYNYDLSLERYIAVGIVFPLLVMVHFINHLRNPDFCDNDKDYKFLSTIYKYVCIPSCLLYIFAGILFG